ncbi:hypothetical protein [Herbaspirillum sp. ST 5-3]|uniref:hypothetical protein n=1 Tax=Oxalobacteraceae TaxID=75682 RepID=UPI00200040D6|nr:hypothetical protein [Herbaspirillum sp. ST 5-3]
MNQESHLPILIGMFPGQVLLDADDIAKCMRVSAGHIYNLASDGELQKKIKLHEEKKKEKGKKQRILVSIIEMARYLDKKLEPEKNEEVQETPIPQLIKKRGRPRGSVSRKQVAFQSQLTLAIIRHEFEESVKELQAQVDSIEFEDNEQSCSEKVAGVKSSFSESIKKTRSHMLRSILEIELSNNKKDNATIRKV